jgi:hypothetical protein
MVVKFFPLLQTSKHFQMTFCSLGWGGYAVLYMFEAVRYKPEGRGFDFRWGFSFA